MTQYIAWIGQGDHCIVETCEASDDTAALEAFRGLGRKIGAEARDHLGDDFDPETFGAVLMKVVALSDDPDWGLDYIRTQGKLDNGWMPEFIVSECGGRLVYDCDA
jgi:hypothetical protein